MSGLLEITTLGGLSIHLDGEPVQGFVSRKVDALLVYLATNPREHPREVLGEMLWDDLPQKRTMSYLRTALSSLQQQLAPYLNVTRQSLSINPDSNYWIDIVQLEEALDLSEAEWAKRASFSRATAKKLEAALELYQGPFLNGFHVRDARGFEGWLVLEQERMKNRVLDALYHMGDYTLRHHLHNAGIAHTMQALQLDPLSEKAHRLMMQLLAESGQRSAALAQFEQCQTLLYDELGVEPEDETIELYEKIIEGEITQSEIHTPHNLPTLASTFIERPVELNQIIEQLEKPGCRLLTMIGPGGIGKTRLALEVARQQLPDFAHGVYLIPFAPVSEPSSILRTIANALDITLMGDEPLETELIKYLSEREILLTLDNFEHLVEGADVLSRILQGAPYIKMLVTSRERLNLQEEWLYTVEALEVPTSVHDENASNFASVRLFVQSVQRIQPEFNFDTAPEAVIRICQLVEGMPLGIELAASWARIMNSEQIAIEIQNSLDFLTSSLRNVPERHRSIRAVFDSSWKMLNEEEQGALRRISVFRGGFQGEAAREAADTSLFILSSLADKSLLSALQGRYEIHELLRQYAESKLQAEEKVQIQTAHSHYFATFLEKREISLSNNRKDGAYTEVLRDFDNIATSWQFALDQGDETLIGRFLRPVYRIFDMQSRYEDGERFFKGASTQLGASLGEDNNLIKTRALILQASCLQSLTKYDEAEKIINATMPILRAFGEEALWETRIALSAQGALVYARSDYEQAQIIFEEVYELSPKTGGDPVIILLRLSDIALVLGQYEKARAIMEQALEHLEDTGGDQSRMRFLLTLGDIDVKLGNLDEARSNFSEALELSERLDAHTSGAVARVSLARVAYGLEEYQQSQQLCQESIAIFDRIKNYWGKGFACIHLGKATYTLGDYAEAKFHYETALQIADEVGSPWLAAATLHHLSKANYQLGNEEPAQQNLQEALKVSLEIQARPLTMEAMTGMAQMYASKGNLEQAAELAIYVLSQPFTEYETLQDAQRLMQQIEGDLPADTLADLQARAADKSLDSVTKQILVVA